MKNVTIKTKDNVRFVCSPKMQIIAIIKGGKLYDMRDIYQDVKLHKLYHKMQEKLYEDR
jgi:hypothetical protein